MRRWLAYAQLGRPGNAALAAFGALAGAAGAVADVRDLAPAPILLTMAAAAIGVAGGNALNDALDAGIDRTAHPGRPIPHGDVSVAGARRFAATLVRAALLLAALVNAWVLLVAVLLAGNLLVYEYLAKSRGLLGHLLVSYNAGALFLLGGLATYGGPFDWRFDALDARLVTPLAMAALALLLNFARELYKAAEDAPHDVAHRRTTFAVQAGAAQAKRIADRIAWATVPLALVPATLGLFDRLYVLLVLPLLLLLLAVPFVGTPRRARALLKVGMLLGLVPFLVPKLI